MPRNWGVELYRRVRLTVERIVNEPTTVRAHLVWERSSLDRCRVRELHVVCGVDYLVREVHEAPLPLTTASTEVYISSLSAVYISSLSAVCDWNRCCIDGLTKGPRGRLVHSGVGVIVPVMVPARSFQ